MTRAWVSLVFLSLGCLAFAGPHEDFIAARTQHGLDEVSTPEELRELKADAVLELRAKVTGSIKGDGGTATLIAVFGPFSQMVEAKKLPMWAEMGVSEVRLIVKARKVDTQLVPALELVASLPEEDVPLVDAKMREAAEKKAEAERKKAEIAMQQMHTASRSGDRGLSSSPPPGSKFSGTIGSVIGGENVARPNQLTALVPDYMAVIMARNKNLEASKAQLIAECVIAYSSSYGVDARLVMAIIQHESNFNPRVTSHAGAQGLGQLMPDTSRSLGITDPFDIVQNVYGTVRTIRGHLERQGKESRNTHEQLVRALAAYNAGPGAVRKYGGLPPYAETEAYVEKVIRTYLQLSGNGN